MRTLRKPQPDNLIAILLFAAIFIFSFAVANGQVESRVIIKGRIIAPENIDSEAYACLVASNGEEMDVMIRSNGKFWVNAPENERYILQVTKPGCFQKEVVVDAHHASKAVSQKKERIIEFDIALHEDDTDRGMTYDGPVGTIRFHHSNGRAKVAHHYQLVPADQTQPSIIAKDEKEPAE